MSSVRERYGEAFWRAHHEAWVQSELNQREYCEAYGIPLKAFGNWRAKFKAEPQTPARKVLYRRGGLSHTLSHGLSHGLSHDLPIGPLIPPAREGSPSDVQRIGQTADPSGGDAAGGASLRGGAPLLRIRRPKYGCRACGTIHQAPAPERPIAKGLASPALLAHVLVSKYCDHTPLYRQTQIFARHGVDIDRSTLANWVGGACWWLEPLQARLAAHVLPSVMPP